MLRIMLDPDENASGGGGGTGDEGGAGAEGNEGAGGGDGGAGDEGAEGAEGGDDDGGGEMQFFEEQGEGDGAEGAGAASGGKKEGAAASAFSFSKFSEIDEEAKDETTAVSRFKKLKEENEDLRVLALGREAIDQDKTVTTFRSLLKETDENLSYMTLVQGYIDAGESKAEAEKQGKADFEKIKAKENGSDEFRRMALATKKELRNAILERENDHVERVKNAQKNIVLRPDDKVVDKSKSEVSKIDSFIGFKLPAGHKDKIVKAAQAYIGSEQERKDLSNPAIRAKFAMFLVHEKQWEQNVKARKSGKIEAVKKAIQHPKVTQGKGMRGPKNANAKGQKGGGLMRNPSAFLGKTV